jgi:hypothetical protein
MKCWKPAAGGDHGAGVFDVLLIVGCEEDGYFKHAHTLIID